MRAIIQRINGAFITIDGSETRETGEVSSFSCAPWRSDTEQQADFLAQKVCELRIFKGR